MSKGNENAEASIKAIQVEAVRCFLVAYAREIVADDNPSDDVRTIAAGLRMTNLAFTDEAIVGAVWEGAALRLAEAAARVGSAET